jgi:hypothetical protein
MLRKHCCLTMFFVSIPVFVSSYPPFAKGRSIWNIIRILGYRKICLTRPPPVMLESKHQGGDRGGTTKFGIRYSLTIHFPMSGTNLFSRFFSRNWGSYFESPS